MPWQPEVDVLEAYWSELLQAELHAARYIYLAEHCRVGCARSVAVLAQDSQWVQHHYGRCFKTASEMNQRCKAQIKLETNKLSALARVNTPS